MRINEDLSNLQHSCYRKKRYSKEMVNKARKSIQRRFKQRLGSYLCYNCNNYHLYTKPKTNG